MAKAPATKVSKGILRDEVPEAEVIKASNAIKTARISMLRSYGFFGSISMRLQIKPADKWLQTAATDGLNFYFNTAFINALTRDELIFLFCHEILHVAYNHVGENARGVGFNKDLSNVAMDYVINAELIEHNIGKMISGGLYEKKYLNWSWEAVYADLMKNVKFINIQDLIDGLLDEHVKGKMPGEDGDGEKGDKGDKEGNGGDGMPSLTPEERKALQDAFKEAALSARAATGAGTLPANLQRMLDDLIAPKIDWRTMLQNSLMSLIKSDYTWKKPNRKMFSSGFSLPSMTTVETVEVAVAIDTSGSITEQQLKEFISEVNGIMESFDEYKIHLWCFDTSIHNPAEFDNYNGSDLLSYVPGGGGGTIFPINWDFMKDRELQPKMLIMFTDGEPSGSWGDPDYCDVLWIINNTREVIPPWGQFCHYDKLTR